MDIMRMSTRGDGVGGDRPEQAAKCETDSQE